MRILPTSHITRRRRRPEHITLLQLGTLRPAATVATLLQQPTLVMGAVAMAAEETWEECSLQVRLPRRRRMELTSFPMAAMEEEVGTVATTADYSVVTATATAAASLAVTTAAASMAVTAATMATTATTVTMVTISTAC
ncbi:hypothetical protein GUJ93_ZPchr0005g14812 [Zizania palustris]|uniref:Uncharacterized protein n=1 Tax=Zizania palustris TaxID=103762 RepID=A0A8J5STW2_ZIZPA|nr:hypothetical protein GUJ93_ZPchr0005g14812 [Zizania palustris]